mmetsp:Transcript_142649/g.455914  ORF Transcript_142649/g.455914 Transcript_142649/m.455914 type:complete len:218 (+) Transcript_142649:732-1385(+)
MRLILDREVSLAHESTDIVAVVDLHVRVHREGLRAVEIRIGHGGDQTVDCLGTDDHLLDIPSRVPRPQEHEENRHKAERTRQARAAAEDSPTSATPDPIFLHLVRGSFNQAEVAAGVARVAERIGALRVRFRGLVESPARRAHLGTRGRDACRRTSLHTSRSIRDCTHFQVDSDSAGAGGVRREGHCFLGLQVSLCKDGRVGQARARALSEMLEPRA